MVHNGKQSIFRNHAVEEAERRNRAKKTTRTYTHTHTMSAYLSASKHRHSFRRWTALISTRTIWWRLFIKSIKTIQWAIITPSIAHNAHSHHINIIIILKSPHYFDFWRNVYASPINIVLSKCFITWRCRWAFRPSQPSSTWESKRPLNWNEISDV